MLELKRRVLEFKLDEEVITVKYPSVKQVSEYSKTYDTAKADDKFDEVVKFLEGLGLAREVCEGMEVSHLETVIKALTEAKKE